MQTELSSWPFLPKSLLQAIDQETLASFVAGLSRMVGFPVVAVDSQTWTQAAQRKPLTPVHRPSKSTTQCWNNFCKLLRSEGMMGFDYCTPPEVAKVGEVMATLGAEPTGSYRCQFGLTNYVFPINVDAKYPIGCLVAGQLTLSEADKDTGLKAVNKLPLPDSKLNVLGDTLIESQVPEPHTLNEQIDVLQMHATFLSDYVTEKTRKLKSEKELELLRSASKKISAYAGNELGIIHMNLQDVLEDIKKFCGFRRIVALLSSPGSDGNILRYAAAFPQLDEKFKRIHYNWRKGGIKSGERHRYLSSTNTKLIRTGLKNIDGNYLEQVTGFVAYSMASGPKALLLGEGNERHVTLEDHRPFFDSIAKNILRTTLSDIQGIALREAVETYSQQMKNGSHHMLDALTNSQFTLGFISKRIAKGDAPKELLVQRLNMIERDIESALNVTKRTLSWERGTPGKDYVFVRYDLGKIVHDSVAVKLDYALHREVKIEVDKSIDSIPPVDVDHEFLRMAFNCIIDNAIKYSHRGKMIKIRATVAQSSVTVAIEDFGLGIAEVEKEKIYTHEHYSKKRGKSVDEPMHGIGLHFAADVIHSHDGTIWHEQVTGQRSPQSNELEGYKVTFYVQLPIARF